MVFVDDDNCLYHLFWNYRFVAIFKIKDLKGNFWKRKSVLDFELDSASASASRMHVYVSQ